MAVPRPASLVPVRREGASAEFPPCERRDDRCERPGQDGDATEQLGQQVQRGRRDLDEADDRNAHPRSATRTER